MIPPQAVSLGISALGKLGSAIFGESSSSVIRKKMIALGNSYLGSYDLTALASIVAFTSSTDPRKQGFENYSKIGLPPVMLFVGNQTKAEAQKVLDMLKNAGAVDSFNRPVQSVVAPNMAVSPTAGTGLNAPGAVGTFAKTGVSGVFKGGNTTNLVPAPPAALGAGALILLIPVALFFAQKAKVI